MGFSDSFSFLAVFIGVAALFFTIGVGLMTSPDTELRRAAFVGFLVGTLIIVASILWATANMLEVEVLKRYLISFFSAGFGGLFLMWIAVLVGIVPKPIALAQVPTPPLPPVQNCTGNCNFGQQGGTVIQNYNQAPQRLEYSDDLAAAILSKLMPQKPVIVKVVGGSADQQIGIHYANYLAAHGVQIQLWSIGMLIPAPDRKISISDQGDKYEVIIAPNAS